MYKHCIALAIYSDSWATMDTASRPGVRGTSFRVIPQSIKIINHSLYSPRENSKMKGTLRERHQNISGEAGDLERTIDGTNKMRDMSERPNQGG